MFAAHIKPWKTAIAIRTLDDVVYYDQRAEHSETNGVAQRESTFRLAAAHLGSSSCLY